MDERPKTLITLAKRRQFAGDEDLALSVTRKGIERSKRLLNLYGSALPQVAVRFGDGEGLKILTNQNIFVAMEETGTGEIPVVVVETKDVKDEKLLSLQLSLRDDSIGALAQGAMIASLIKEHGFTLGQLSKALSVRKPWLCKRQFLALKLSSSVKKLVAEGSLPPRSAEEVSRLPHDAQLRFVEKAMDMPKEKIAKLVAMYNDPTTHDEVKRMILDAPHDVTIGEQSKTRKVRAKGDGAAKLENLLRFAARANLTAYRELKTLNWKTEAKLPDEKAIESVICPAEDLADLARLVLEEYPKLTKLHASSVGSGGSVSTKGGKSFPQGNMAP
jgi:ParB-like chromosome segregation protein Spo0J